MVFVCKNAVALDNRNFISSQNLFSSRISLASYNLFGRRGRVNSHRIVQMRKLRLREINRLVQSHTHN